MLQKHKALIVIIIVVIAGIFAAYLLPTWILIAVLIPGLIPP